MEKTIRIQLIGFKQINHNSDDSTAIPRRVNRKNRRASILRKKNRQEGMISAKSSEENSVNLEIYGSQTLRFAGTQLRKFMKGTLKQRQYRKTSSNIKENIKENIDSLIPPSNTKFRLKDQCCELEVSTLQSHKAPDCQVLKPNKENKETKNWFETFVQQTQNEGTDDHLRSEQSHNDYYILSEKTPGPQQYYLNTNNKGNQAHGFTMAARFPSNRPITADIRFMPEKSRRGRTSNKLESVAFGVSSNSKTKQTQDCDWREFYDPSNDFGMSSCNTRKQKNIFLSRLKRFINGKQNTIGPTTYFKDSKANSRAATKGNKNGANNESKQLPAHYFSSQVPRSRKEESDSRDYYAQQNRTVMEDARRVDEDIYGKTQSKTRISINRCRQAFGEELEQHMGRETRKNSLGDKIRRPSPPRRPIYHDKDNRINE